MSVAATSTRMPTPLAANVYCMLAMLLWATGFPAGEILLETWGAVSLIALRLGIAAVFLMTLWIIVDGVRPILEAPWRTAILVGGTGFGLGSLLMLLGQKYSDAVTPAIAAAIWTSV